MPAAGGRRVKENEKKSNRAMNPIGMLERRQGMSDGEKVLPCSEFDGFAGPI
jgi:hypothetical protein